MTSILDGGNNSALKHGHCNFGLEGGDADPQDLCASRKYAKDLHQGVMTHICACENNGCIVETIWRNAVVLVLNAHLPESL